MPGAPVEIIALRKAFAFGGRPIEVLKGIDLSIKAGEMVAVVGASGAGKSTFLHVLGTLDAPTEGRICIDGEELTQMNAVALAAGIDEGTLAPGQHSFRVVGGAECCVERTIVSDVPAGEEPLELPLRLAFRPASVYVVANLPADVAVAGSSGTSQGRTREILSVPMTRAEDTRRLTVTAEGHRVYTGVLRLRAGQLTEHRVSLEPGPPAQETPTPPPP